MFSIEFNIVWMHHCCIQQERSFIKICKKITLLSNSDSEKFKLCEVTFYKQFYRIILGKSPQLKVCDNFPRGWVNSTFS